MGNELKLTWGRDLPGELADRWPLDDKGEYVAPALLAEVGELDLQDTIIIGMLESYGIPCLKLYPHYGGFGKLIIGMSAEGVSLFVPETMIDDARALMNGEPFYEEL